MSQAIYAIEVCQGLPETHRTKAAEIYWAAFQQKLGLLLSSKEAGEAIIRESFGLSPVIVAVSETDLVGMAILQTPEETSFIPKPSSFTTRLGLVRGLFGYCAWTLSQHKPQAGGVWVDVLAVDPAVRGEGIGTRLLDKVFEYARSQGYHKVGLDVVDTNHGARRLYERMGFVATRTRKLPFFVAVAGFTSVISMGKEI